MAKYDVEILLSTGEAIKLKEVEASSEDDAISTVADLGGADYVHVREGSTYYKIFKSELVGFKVTSLNDSDDGPVQQNVN